MRPGLVGDRPAVAGGRRLGRIAALDRWRGLAVVLLLADHILEPVEAMLGFHWLYFVRLLTRPALPLFMVVSGSLLELRWAPGIVGRQFRRVVPFAVVASYFAWLIPGFGIPEPLTCYLVGLLLVWAFRGREWLGLACCMLYALAGPWPFQGYDPAEQAAWLLVGVLMVRSGRRWWERLELPAWLERLGVASLWWYTGELVVVGLLSAAVQVAGWVRL